MEAHASLTKIGALSLHSRGRGRGAIVVHIDFLIGIVFPFRLR